MSIPFCCAVLTECKCLQKTCLFLARCTALAFLIRVLDKRKSIFCLLQIADLPPNLFHCHELRELILYDNELKSLPSAISSLHRLVRLDVSRNGKMLYLYQIIWFS